MKKFKLETKATIIRQLHKKFHFGCSWIW